MEKVVFKKIESFEPIKQPLSEDPRGHGFSEPAAAPMKSEKETPTHFIPCNPVARGESWLRRSFLENEELYKTGVCGEFPKVRLYKPTGEIITERVEPMWESPITLVENQLEFIREEETFKAVLKLGIDVNKDELLKALRYDRKQYEKGFAVGRLIGFREGVNALLRLLCEDRVSNDNVRISAKVCAKMLIGEEVNDDN